MNKKLLYISIVLVAAITFFSSCYKDKGNYDYTTINKITVTDARAANRIFIYQGDTLRLSPTISQTLPVEGLTYLWFANRNTAGTGGATSRDTIAKVKDLNYVIDSKIFVLGEDYRLTVKVTDPKTGVSSFLFYELTISNKLGQGWMLFEEKASGAGDLSMILPNNTIERNVYSSINPSAPLGKPVAINSTSFNVTDDLSSPGKRIYLLTENDGLELNALTMQKKFPLGYLYFALPSVVKPTFQGWAAYGTTTLNPRMGVAVNNGKVHVNLVGGFPGIKKWGEALIAPNGSYDYEIAPEMAGATAFSPTYPIVMYDNKYKRFYSVGTVSLAGFPASASTVFDMNNVGLDLLKLDSSNVSGVWNAVMKDATTPYLLQFKTTATVADPVITVSKVAMNAPGLINTKVITASTQTPHIYYSAGNTIAKYETTSNTTAEVFSFPAGENVTKLVYQKVVPGTGGARVVAVTWNGTESKVYFFAVSAVGDLGASYSNVFTGFAKIVDLAYKTP